ncbi:MAG: hypothetical protein AAF799_16105 [Myxococcota bacterium]
MKRSLWLVLPLVAACAGAEHTGSEPAPTPMPAPTPSEQPSAPSDAWQWRSDMDLVASHTLVGVVGQGGFRRCAEGSMEGTWVGLYPTIGRVSLSGPPDSIFDPLMDQPVVALGEPQYTSPRKTTAADDDAVPCPPMQMRSDWTPTPRGMRIDRRPAPMAQHFEVAAVRPLHELSIKPEGEFVVITLNNPVAIELRDVEMRVHYEGCFGKPGSRVETSEVGVLAPLAQISTRAPKLLEGSGPPGRSTFRAHSFQLVARGEAVTIDLDASLSAMGIDNQCPRKR